MKLRNRKIVVFLLMAMFLIAAPTVLIFASGYKYNWHKHKIEKTGMIHVSTEPPGASVTVDSEPAEETTPVLIQNLLPEEYLVTVEMTGYMSWSKNLRVESGRTTFAKDLTMFSTGLPRLLKSADISVGAFSDDGTEIAYLADNEEWTELSLYDFKTGDTLLLARFAKGKYDDAALAFSADGSSLLFDVRPTGQTGRDLVIYPISVDGQGIDVAPGLGGKAGLSAVWSSDDASMIAFGEAGAFTVDTALGTIEPLPAGRAIRDAWYEDGAVWLVREGDETDLLERIRPDGGSAAENVIALPRKGYGFIGGNGQYLILTDGRAGGGLLIDTLDGGLHELPHAKGLAWEYPDRTGRMILWNDFEIAVVEPGAVETTLITRIGTGVGNCGWHPAGTYILYADRDGITAVEMDSRDHRNVYRLVGFDSITTMTIDREALVLRFVGAIGSQKGIFERPL